MSTVSNENLVVSDSSESEEETDSAPHPPTVEVDGRISPGTSQFYASGKDISSETDVRFHISKSECHCGLFDFWFCYTQDWKDYKCFSGVRHVE